MKSDPVIQLLDLVWGETNSGTSHSWERLNHAMRAALEMAIGAGFPFAEDTLATVAAKYRFGRWCGDSIEWIYTQAIAEGNAQAVASFEAWQKRTAFIADDVDPGNHHRYAHLAGNRDRERLAVGFKFKWQGRRVTVTSFSKDQKSLTACSYKRDASGDYRKVEKRFTITREDIIVDRAERKERTALMATLAEAVKLHGLDAVTAALKVKSQTELDVLPIARLRKVAERFPVPEKGAA